ncbi:aminotransferase-like domain-containing protein [Hylemonella gracilis]|uniref:Transcriptional regulator gntr family with aminotransferase domain n=1 Tax=Hylemonella gracilis ATCC 19624 TaxID=887062 RepID=F3KSM8_9BURK|nr:PLP-dependent aminotransferase family protein [Hylemonella gracilis]EGI77097.1 transcriptional regulator gntr family with aminotransferase domain [Hylemonella gracilis ATCC 19624]
MGLPRYKTLVDAYANDIRAGKLTPGTRLPTHRKLAAEHGLALVTASRVYAELEAMGLVTGETGRGTFVRDAALPEGLGIDQQTVASDMVDLSFNYPALPGQAEMLRAALKQLAASGDLDALLRYQPHGGRPHERAIVARHLASQGLKVDASRVLITSGAQHGLTVVAMALLKPGDVVATDALTYPGMKVLAELLRLELVPVPAEADGRSGPNLLALERLCKQRRVRAVYVQPTVHNPLGWVMGQGHRQHLAALAQRHGLLLIEDAAYAFLADNAPPPLAALAPDSTVHVSGFSKNVATGLRVGYVAAPQAWVPRIERAIRASTWNTPSVMTALVCGWLEDGTVQALESAKRKDARKRQALVAKALQDLPYLSHPASYVAWLPLPEGARADRVAGELLAQGISVSTAEPFCTAAHVPQAIRLALGSVDLAMLRTALSRVREVVELSGD